MQMPCTKMVAISISWEPMDTAETAAEPVYLPTTNRSTAPYTDCRKLASMNGSANSRSTGAILPFISLLSCLSMDCPSFSAA